MRSETRHREGGPHEVLFDHTYIVECRDDLVRAIGRVSPRSASVQGSGERNSVVDTDPSPHGRCYRVRLTQQNAIRRSASEEISRTQEGSGSFPR